jgi:hypothetical protein
MSKHSGGCLCGGVRYEFEAEPLFTAVCHCRNCQKQAGSAFSIVVAIPAGALKITGDSLTHYKDMGDDSGQPVLRWFCRGCGSPIKSDLSSVPGVEFVKAGTLDDVGWLAPTVEVWCDSAQPWIRIESPMQEFSRNPAA